jgi:inner membrane protein
MGLKFMVVCGLALLMSIAGLFVTSVVEDRAHRADAVVREVSAHVGGEQTFLGPTLAIPCSFPSLPATDPGKHAVFLISPERGSAVVKTKTEERRRSLFLVPVFQADLVMDAAFDLSGVGNAVPEGAELEWNKAAIVIGVSDARGALADATVAMDNKTLTLVPASYLLDFAGRSKLSLFGASAGDVAKPNANFTVSSALRFSGAQRVAVLAYAKTTHVVTQGDWPSPGFDGGFLPVSRTVNGQGFAAEWSVPFIARGVPAAGLASAMAGLDATALGVSFVEVADPYQSVSRSLKYIPLFLGLIFLAHFLFETTTGKRVHPAQYILVGIAQLIFYLLLLSLAERIGFDSGFLIAGAATVCLLACNAGWIFSSRLQAARAFAIFTLLYSLIYFLLRLEDNALLVGAVASFLAVAAAMYFTRKIEWYSAVLTPKVQTEPQGETA